MGRGIVVGVVVVAECTIGAVKTEKIDRLLQATKNILETLGLKEAATEKVISMVFTCLPETSAGTKEIASKSGVRIKDSEDTMISRS